MKQSFWFLFLCFLFCFFFFDCADGIRKKEIIFGGTVFATLMFDIDQKALEAAGLVLLFLFKAYLSKLLVI